MRSRQGRSHLEKKTHNGDSLRSSLSLLLTPLPHFSRRSGGYPEQDRTNRHTLASLAVHVLKNGVAGEFEVDRGMKVEREFTVLSKCVSAVPREADWAELIGNPGPAQWPDPENYVPQEKVVE